MYDYRYIALKIIVFLIVYFLNDFIPINWIFLIAGAAVPPLHLIIFREDLLFKFPWELYLFYAYLFYSIFSPIDPQIIYSGIGFSLSRLILYFQITKKNE